MIVIQVGILGIENPGEWPDAGDPVVVPERRAAQLQEILGKRVQDK
jgi:hypothetical protein